MSLNIKINSEVLRHLKDKAQGEIDKGMLRFITYAEGLAVKNSPVAPIGGGNLRASITSGVEGGVAYLKATAPYAVFVHEGTGIFGPKGKVIIIKPRFKKALFWAGALHPVKKVVIKGMRPRPFFREAIEEAYDKIPPSKLFGETL